jgi:hypothetical protein
MAKKPHDDKKMAAGFGMGLALAAAAAAGAYFLYGTKEGAKHRKKITGWSVKMKGEVLEKLENVKEVNEDTYKQVIETVGEKYRKLQSIDSADVDKAVRELKGYWKHIKGHEKSPKKRVKRSVKKTPKK